jgi:hypothetical protein
MGGNNMKRTTLLVVTMLTVAGCSSPDVKKGDTDVAKAINCSTAEGDIRALIAEKAHTSQEIAAGVTSIVPIGAVAHMFEGKEGQSLKVGTGEYNRALDNKIAEIRQQCNVQ